jgi:multidrug resistance protein, MATE family
MENNRRRGEEEETKVKVPLLEAAAKPPQVDDDDSSLSLGRRAWEENKKLWVVAGPSIFTRFSSFGVTVISQAFIGHIGPTELAAYALVSTVLMRFSNGILVSTLL